MIQEVANVELFELLETDPKMQCKACLSYWNIGIVYCTCGHLFKETVANRGFFEFSLDFLSILEYVIKKGRPHGHRYGKLPGNREYYLANNLKKRCIKRDCKGIHDRFLRDHVFRGRTIENRRDEEVCRRWDVLADKDHTYHLSEEYFYYKNRWWLHLNKSGSDTLPVRKRSDFKTSIVYLRTFTPRRWRRTIRAHSLLEVQTMETSIEFFLNLVAMARILVVFLKNSQKVKKEEASKGL